MKFKIVLVLLVSWIFAYSQTPSEAENLFQKKQFSKALTAYELLISKKNTDPQYNYRLGVCYFQVGDYANAVKCLKRATSKFAQRDLYLAQSLYNNYQFAESLEVYKIYLSTLKDDDSHRVEIDLEVAKAEKAVKLFTKIQDVAIIDSMLVPKSDFLSFYKRASDLGSITQQQIKLNSRKVLDKICYTTQRNDRKIFTDTIAGKSKLFSSFKLIDEWSRETLLPENINSKGNENYPFLSQDGITLYFASDGENSLGGYDIFVTRYIPSTNSYLTPENIGFPFNSLANDYMFVIDDLHDIGWFATDRNQSSSKVMIYSFELNRQVRVFKSQQFDSLRLAAELKLYRKAKKMNTSNQVLENKVCEHNEKFIVNDSVVYSNSADFKSADALKLWESFNELRTKLKLSQSKLLQLRIEYSTFNDQMQKNKLVDQITALEFQNIDCQKKIINLQLEIRSFENAKLKSISKGEK